VSGVGGSVPRARQDCAPEFIEQLRARRVELGLTQQQLAQKCGWPDKSRIGKYEDGHAAVHPRNLLRWAAGLGLRIVAVPDGDVT
jgi:transcriptional regulator with XRE-family HTH domain